MSSPNGHTSAEEAEQRERQAPREPSASSRTGGYSRHEHRPMGAYAAMTAAFLGGTGGALAWLRRRGQELPERMSAGDIVLIGVATHKLSRIATKDKSTSFLRSPFTRFEASTGHGEVAEAARGEGLQLAIGELLICPYCLAQWVAGALTVSFVAQPRFTRLLSSCYAALTISDFLQLAYRGAEDRLG